MINANCLICQDKFSSNDGISALLCGHIFHNNCIGLWFANKKNCPICRYVQGTKHYVEKLFLVQIDNGDCSLSQNEDFHEKEAMLTCKITKLQMINKELADKYEDGLKDHREKCKDIDVITSLNASLSRTLESLKVEIDKIKNEKLKLESDFNILKKQNDKRKFIDLIIKGYSDEIAEKVQSIRDSDDLPCQLDILSTALIVTQKNKSITDENNNHLTSEAARLKQLNISLVQKVDKLRESLSISQKESSHNKEQLERLENYFQMKNVNLPILSNVVKNKENLENHAVNDTNEEMTVINEENLNIISEFMNEGHSTKQNINFENPFLCKNNPVVEKFSIMRKVFQDLSGQTNGNNSRSNLPAYVNSQSIKSKTTPSMFSINTETKKNNIVFQSSRSKPVKRKSSGNLPMAKQSSIKDFIKQF